MLETLQELDAQFLLALNGFHTPLADRFMWAFTGRWVWVPLYIALAWYLWRRLGWKYALVGVAAVGLAVTIADQTCATLIRPVAERLRPANLNNPLSEFVHIVDNYRGGAYGFPSCHAANTFALASFFAWISRRNLLWIMLFTWAAANCYTRMYLGVHYPGDLLVGALIGSAAGTLSFWLVRYAAPIPLIYGYQKLFPVYVTAGITLLFISLYAIIG